MKSIYNDVFRLVEAEKSAISKKAFDVLNAEGIADITENNGRAVNMDCDITAIVKDSQKDFEEWLNKGE